MRSAFVVTASVATVLGCQPKPSPEVIKNDNPPKVVSSASASETAEAPPPLPPNQKETRRRKRTSDAGGTWKVSKAPSTAARTLVNPKDGAGHSLFISYDDRCYYEEPGKGTPPPMPTGSRFVDFIYVDCPKEADDPAWDDCTGSTMHAIAGLATCECYSMGGNPPPPPREVACPKK